MENKAKAGLFKKILAVLAATEAIEKTGYNSHQSYSYATENDLLDAIRNNLVKNNLMILTSSEYKHAERVVNKDKENLITIIETTHTFADTESGETFSVKSVGSGHDSLDKGAYKAITGAMKYFVSKNFMVATEDDPENDGVSPRKQKGNSVQPAKGLNIAPSVIKPSASETKEVDNSVKAVTSTLLDLSQTKTPAPDKQPSVQATQIKFPKRNVQTEQKTEPKF
jgi:hypothetical protein